VDEFTIRRATADDIAALVHLRRLMFEWMGFSDPAQLDASDEACRRYFEAVVPSGEYLGWLAVTKEGQAVAAGGLVVDTHAPHPDNPSGKVGYILNISTEPAYRRRGLARRILQAIMDYANAQGIMRLELQASEMGRPLYESVGFVPVPVMRLKRPPSP
jgi:GNAT superfamily N-acetyltransferase